MVEVLKFVLDGGKKTQKNFLWLNFKTFFG